MQQSRACWLTSVMSCRNQGCPDMACRICMQNPNRRCRGNFADKYLAGDVLKATCGAPIRVEIINRTTGDSPSKQEYADVFLEVPLSDNPAIGHPLIGIFTLIACCSCQGLACTQKRLLIRQWNRKAFLSKIMQCDFPVFCRCTSWMGRHLRAWRSPGSSTLRML